MIFIKVQQSYTCFQKNNKNVSFKRTEHQNKYFTERNSAWKQTTLC